MYNKAKIKAIIESSDSSNRESNVFSNLIYNKNGNSNLVSPYLHYIDDRGLKNSVNDYIESKLGNRELSSIAKKYNKELVNPDSLESEVRTLWASFPKGLVADIYNIYYNDISDLEFNQRDHTNEFAYNFLEKASDPVIKVLTIKNSIRSMIFTRSLVQYYLFMLAMLQQEDYTEFKEMMKQLKGDGSPLSNDESDQEEGNGSNKNQKTKDKSLKEILENLKKRFNDGKNGSNLMLNKVMQDAHNATDMINNLMTEEQQEELWKNISSNNKEAIKHLKRTDPRYLEKIKNELKKVEINMTSIKDKIKLLLNNSLSYFSSKEITTYETLLESSSLDGLEDWILLHPKLRKVFINDILLKETKKVGKIDIYLDVSGSMASSCGITDKQSKPISKELFIKAFSYTMKELNLLENVYSFQTTVKEVGNSLYDILTVSGGGGTNLNEVVKNINIVGRNSIILTDAEDKCNIYSPYAYFIGVSGADYNRFSKDVLVKYKEKKQLIIFDGKSIKSIT